LLDNQSTTQIASKDKAIIMLQQKTCLSTDTGFPMC